MKMEVVEPKQEEREYILSIFPPLREIEDATIKENVVRTWITLLHASKWKKIEDLPYKEPWEADMFPDMFKKERFVDHCNAVARLAMDMAKYPESEFNMKVKKDYVIAAANLHDCCALLEFEGPEWAPAPVPEMSKFFAHSEIGAFAALLVGLPLEIVHAIRSHTISSTLEPKTVEARIVRYADFLIYELMAAAYGYGTFLLSTAELARRLDGYRGTPAAP
jgi:putative nucleotidyltransferase with HDIG domain